MAEAAMIFLVDDDEAVRDSLKLLLESYDCLVEDFGSTREFLKAYRPRDKQCLVLDHHLPGENGLDFLESIDGTSLRIPVILMTGGGDRALKERALRAGVTAYVDKPPDNTILLGAIFTAIGIDAAP